MATITAEYLGDLKMSLKHHESNTVIITDAPVDNGGKGESFSPTDLCASSLATCAMTIIGLYANTHNIDVKGTKLDIVKIMSKDPRRIAKIEVTMHMPQNDFSEHHKKGIEHCINACPVHHSLHPEVEKVFNVIW